MTNFAEILATLPADLVEVIEEKAGALEYGAGLSRADAEDEALRLAGIRLPHPDPLGAILAAGALPEYQAKTDAMEAEVLGDSHCKRWRQGHRKHRGQISPEKT